MPTVSLGQYGLMQGIAHGSIAPKGGLTPAKAEEFIHATPPAKRKKFAKANARKKKYKRMAKAMR